eukprot:m.34903 g.34903  ORF g.34903 m.34903 type:complete len:412 (+) comp7384_c0_seq1:122-1357(+)
MAADDGRPTKRLRQDGPVKMLMATCTAPVNIAVIKYWGKRDEQLLLPINSSLSATLHQDQLHAKTTVAISEDFSEDRIWLNGTEEDIGNKRLQNCFREIRVRAQSKNPDDPRVSMKIRVCSENNFPTAAGLASSAAGYACLVAALAEVFGVADTELSSIARVGSGSACRSIYGGWVRWTLGERDDGVDSIASQVAPADHWPEMQILVFVVNAGKKSVSSSSGMQTSVKTSALIDHRAKVVVPQRMKDIEAAILAKDFDAFGRITIQDSNQFHAVCLDTYPPIFYMNDVSKSIVGVLSRYNAHAGKVKAAYTFDAGPNCVVYCLKSDVDEILSLVHTYFPPTTEPEDGKGYYRGITSAPPATPLPESIKTAVAVEPQPNSIRYVLHTEPGPGPIAVKDPAASLLDESGLPKH